jgi:hypothetical protein
MEALALPKCGSGVGVRRGGEAGIGARRGRCAGDGEELGVDAALEKLAEALRQRAVHLWAGLGNFGWREPNSAEQPRRQRLVREN